MMDHEAFNAKAAAADLPPAKATEIAGKFGFDLEPDTALFDLYKASVTLHKVMVTKPAGGPGECQSAEELFTGFCKNRKRAEDERAAKHRMQAH